MHKMFFVVAIVQFFEIEKSLSIFCSGYIASTCLTLLKQQLNPEKVFLIFNHGLYLLLKNL